MAGTYAADGIRATKRARCRQSAETGGIRGFWSDEPGARELRYTSLSRAKRSLGRLDLAASWEYRDAQ
jgi:hypothetical protein